MTLPVHSPLGASQYDRWGKSLGGCPGSVRLCATMEKAQSSPYAERGTEAHTLAYAKLSGHPFTSLGEEEEDEAVDLYVRYIEETASATDSRVWRRLEHRFDLTKYYPNLYGTADAIFYWYGSKKLRVVDYKHGAGVPVDVVENPQLMYYGLGAMHALGLPVNEIELVIVQPRCHHHEGPIRSWSTNAARLLDFVADLIDDAKATEAINAVLIPGDHCRWCAAKGQCPALKSRALAAAENSFSSLAPYDPNQLAKSLLMIPALESWIKGVREFAYLEAEKGRVPPGWKLVDKRAHRKWRDDVNLDNIARNLGLKMPEVFETKMKSPAQVEKLMAKEHRHVLKDFVTQESSGKTLVQTSDNRPQVKERASLEFDSLL